MKMKRGTILVIIMGVVIIIVFLIVGISTSRIERAEPVRTLQMVHIVMRHGIRTPATTFPNDPYINETFYPVGWGQITNSGKLQMYNVGVFLRERYDKFLGSFYSPDEYLTQCTGVDRTKVSMQLVNAGLWPPNDNQAWGPLNWQPIPIVSETLEDDSLLLVRRPCAQYHIEREKVLESPEVKEILKQYDTLFKELTELTGQKTQDLDGVQDIYTTLLAEETYNLTLPEYIKPYYSVKMYEPTIESFIINAYNDKMNRLKGGVLLKKFLSDWKAKEEGRKTKKCFLYGGHDSTVVNILRSLKVWDKQFPGYAITILFELSKDETTNDYGLEIYLRNSTQVPPFKLTIPGCDSFCPLQKLIELTKNVIPENWEEECKTEDADFIVPTPGGP